MTSNRAYFVSNPQLHLRSVAQWTGWQCPPLHAVSTLKACEAGAIPAFTGGSAFLGGGHGEGSVFGKRLKPNRDSPEGAGP
jgi:hypothetical protein